MSDKEARRRLAGLIVGALEVGTGKNEQNVIEDLFDSFGLDFATLDRQFPQHRFAQQRTPLLRKAAAEQLAGAAPTTAVLLNAVVCLGGRFVSMVEEIYQRLARHTATTTGTSESFRLRRSDVDESPLTISSAFVEQVRRLTSTLTTIQVGRIDDIALRSFVGSDNGEFYGTWPPRAAGSDRLADHILALGWITPAVADQAANSAIWAEAADAVATATRAAERVIGTAEWLVRSYLTSLDAFSNDDGVVRRADVFTDETSNWIADQRKHDLQNEVNRYRNSEILVDLALPGHVSGIDEPAFLGLDRQLGPVHVPALGRRRSGTGMGMLAGFVAQWRDGHWSLRSRERLEPKLFGDPQSLTQWLTILTSHCHDAAEWLATKVLHPTMPLDATTLLESIEEFLNLPLWRQRDLLYEVWVLCATLDACEHAGWRVHLVGTADADGVWELPDKATDKPVGQLLRQSTRLDVWREPTRTSARGVVTPDVTVATPAPYARELVVVEAKDRRRMRGREALLVAQRYAAELCPAVTWVVNHCDYRRDADPLEELGTVWSRIRLAAQFRPGNVPAAFADTIRDAVTPPDDQASGVGQSQLLLVVDRTKSMTSNFANARRRMLNSPLATGFDQFRAIAYADHGDHEPFLVRAIEPSTKLIDVLDALDALPSADGGDWDEALEDALRRCRELVADVGPQTILILTDAPAHSLNKCPYRIDAGNEARALLDDGCRLLVADDWRLTPDGLWDTVLGHPGFDLAPLDTITNRLYASHRENPSIS